MDFPDNNGSTKYRLSEALFTGDPAGILTGSFSDTGRGIGFTLSAGGSAFTNLWSSAHVVWRARRRLDNSPVPLYASHPYWTAANLELLWNTAPAATENIRVQALLVGGVPNATVLTDFSGGTPVILGGGLNHGNASGPQAVVSNGTSGGTASGARGTTVMGSRFGVNCGPSKTSTEPLFTSGGDCWTVKSDGTTANTGGSLGATLINSILDATNTELYFMLSILKIGSATGGAYEISPRSRIDLREALS